MYRHISILALVLFSCIAFADEEMREPPAAADFIKAEPLKDMGSIAFFWQTDRGEYVVVMFKSIDAQPHTPYEIRVGYRNGKPLALVPKRSDEERSVITFVENSKLRNARNKKVASQLEILLSVIRDRNTKPELKPLLE